MDTAVNERPSPFHPGEHEAQSRAGVRDEMEAFGRRMIRDHMPEQHREFYAELPFVLVGSVDVEGRPWASIVTGRSGFMSTPDRETLDIAMPPLAGDPLGDNLKSGEAVGILGFQPGARRRNRLTGRIGQVRDGGFSIGVSQSFGNCPQYIQTREIDVLPDIDTPHKERPTQRMQMFDAPMKALIEQSDTLFIATRHEGPADTASSGADMSHRGGKPGFVRIEDDRSFVFPDFSGNFHFNTIGNILTNPKAGFLFIDFETRDLVYLTGRAEIVWDGEEVSAFEGAERLIRFHLDEAIRVTGSLPLIFKFGDYSPVLERTGDWSHAAETIAANQERNAYIDYEVFDVQPESDVITSFYLRRADGKALASHQPGQFLPIRLDAPNAGAPASRTYTLSDAPGAGHYRLSIKREGGAALVSNHFHDQMSVGSRVQAMAPRGKFTLDRSSDRPVVLLSGGVGVTPMIAMANFIIAEGKRTRQFRRTYFIHGARNGTAHAFGDYVRDLAARHPAFTAHVRYSDPCAGDRLGETHDSEGRVDVELLKSLLPLDDYDFYICGPAPFMQALYDGLAELGVRGERIHYESFGPATVITSDAAPEMARAVSESGGAPVNVRFEGSDVTLEWTPEKGTLLDLAEEAGLKPLSSCRSGICGTCATRLKSGAVDYVEEPTAPHEDDEVLLCCSTPRSVSGDASCGKNVGVVLDL